MSVRKYLSGFDCIVLISQKDKKGTHDWHVVFAGLKYMFVIQHSFLGPLQGL